RTSPPPPPPLFPYTTLFRSSDTITIANLISGTGALTQAGSGALILTNDNTYSGGTTINAGGTLQIGNGTTTGSLGAGNVTDNGRSEEHTSELQSLRHLVCRL